MTTSSAALMGLVEAQSGSELEALSSNWIVVRGNLGRTPEYRTTARGSAMLTFSVAVDRRVGPVVGRGPKQLVTDWINVSVFGQLVEHIGPQLERGKNVTVVGRITVRRGNDARLYYGVVAEDVQINLDRASYTQVSFEGKLGLDPVWDEKSDPSGQNGNEIKGHFSVGNYDESRGEYRGRDYPSSPLTWLTCMVKGDLARKLKQAQDEDQSGRLQLGQDVRVRGWLEVERHQTRGEGQGQHQQFVIQCTQLDVFEDEEADERAESEEGDLEEVEEVEVVSPASAHSIASQPLTPSVKVSLEKEEITELVADRLGDGESESALADLDILNNPRWQERHEPTQHLASYRREELEAYRLMLVVLSPLAEVLKELIWYFYEQNREVGLDEGAAWWLAQNMFIERIARLGLITGRQKARFVDIVSGMSEEQPGVTSLGLGQYPLAQLKKLVGSVVL